MVNIEKIINVVDAVCDCIPVVSSFTNGTQLLYKLARKVDATANPVNTTWRDDVKIHVINKSKFECLIAMIPIIGNLTNLIAFIIIGLRDQLMYSVVSSNTESIKLHLARHPLNDNQKAKRILGQAAFSSKPEVFELIFKSRTWDIHSVIEALRSCWCPNESKEENANLILDYYDKHLNNSDILEDHTYAITSILKDFIKAGRAQTASRILNILPQCDFARFEEILAIHSYRSYSSFRSKEGVLTEDQIEGIISRCKPCTLKKFTEYCRKVHNEAESLGRDVDSNNNYNQQYHPNREKLNKHEIMNDFYEVHNGIIQKLLNLVTEIEQSSLIDSLSSLANNGEIQLLEMFLVKYENQLTSEDKLSIIRKTRQSFFENGSALKGLKHFFTKYNHDLTDEQCMELLQWFSEPPFNNTPIIEKIIEIRPSLETNFGSQLEEIKNKCKKNGFVIANYTHHE